MIFFFIGIKNMKVFFIEVKQTSTHSCELRLPNTKKTFFIVVDACAIGVGTVLFQADDKDLKQVISYNSYFY